MNVENKFHSWTIINHEMVEKESDKSFFEHHGSGLPIELRSFFDVDQIPINHKEPIILIYQHVEYKGHIEYRETKVKSGGSTKRTRIFWSNDLKQQLLPFYNEDDFPVILFKKLRKHVYEISIKGVDFDLLDEIEKQDIDYHKVRNVEEQYTMMMDDLEYQTLVELSKELQLSEEQIYELNHRPIVYPSSKNPNKRPLTKGVWAQYVAKINDYRCECASEEEPHTTFITASLKDYVEVHHLIPLKYQRQYTCNLDRTDNLVVLCPNCHNALHYGSEEEKRKRLKVLFHKKATMFEIIKNEEVITSYEELYEKYYKI